MPSSYNSISSIRVIFSEHSTYYIVSSPTLLFPIVDTNTDEVLSGEIKIHKKVKEKNLGFTSIGMPVVVLNNAVYQGSPIFPAPDDSNHFLIPCGGVGSYNQLSQ